jgi:ubiquinone/menaquinone biosynthesis C-methylase UbiE
MKVIIDDKKVLQPSSKEFEQLYFDLRSHEKRMYTDEEVARLPEVDENHIYRKEWEIRKASVKKLIRYFQRKRRPLKILEVGCGNGWLSYQLSQIPYSTVTGIDINLQELQQAERVFAAIPNLSFLCCDIDSLELEAFDVIVFAAAIQYFPSFPRVIDTSLSLLNEGGEIHIIDSHFYWEDEVAGAEERSYRYFLGQGFTKMSEFYFHHSLVEVEAFNFSILYDPKSGLNKIFKKKNPFYWIRIKK